MESGLKLLPCPFCGGEAEINQIGNMATKSRGFEVRCTAWGCSTKKRSMIIRRSLENARTWAVKRWNTRAPSDAALVEALEDVTAHLAAAISLLSRSPKTGAASNKMFDQMLVDYDNSAARGRAALAAAKGQQP